MLWIQKDGWKFCGHSQFLDFFSTLQLIFPSVHSAKKEIILMILITSDVIHRLRLLHNLHVVIGHVMSLRPYCQSLKGHNNVFPLNDINKYDFHLPFGLKQRPHPSSQLFESFALSRIHYKPTKTGWTSWFPVHVILHVNNQIKMLLPLESSPGELSREQVIIWSNVKVHSHQSIQVGKANTNHSTIKIQNIYNLLKNCQLIENFLF